MDRRRSLLKIAALRSERERQTGVNCTKGYLQSRDAGLLFEGPRTLECLFRYIPSDKIQVIAGFGITMIEIYALTTNQLRVYCGGGNATVDIVPGDSYLVDVAYDGPTAICYLNGAEATRFPVTGYKITDLFRTGSNTYIPQGSLVFCRHYNYAISAEEAAVHYNDGDPAGYVLPGTMKGLTPVEIIGENSHTWTGVDDSNYSHIVRVSRPFTMGKLYKIRLIISNWEAGNNPFIKIGTTGSYYLPDFNGNGTYEIYATPNGTPYSGVYIYAGLLNTDRRMTITVDSIESVGCVAEYLPQNLVGSSPHDDPIEITGENSHTWTGVDDPVSFNIKINRVLSVGGVFRITGSVSNYKSGTPYLNLGNSSIAYLPKDNSPFTLVVTLKKGSSTLLPYIYIYGGSSSEDKQLTITVDSIEPVSDVALSWLDSARQLPLNDEYLPPLLQSDGGYDLTASGTPEIIIK